MCSIIQSTSIPQRSPDGTACRARRCPRGSASRITAVMPISVTPDRIANRAANTDFRKLVANPITVAGADRVLTMDLHAGQIQGFFDIPLDNLFSAPVFIRHIKKTSAKKT